MALIATFGALLLIFSGAILGQAFIHAITSFLGARYLSLLPDRFLNECSTINHIARQG